jgi:hypothetical protein
VPSQELDKSVPSPKSTAINSDSESVTSDSEKWYDQHLERADTLIASTEWSILLENWVKVEKDLGDKMQSVSARMIYIYSSTNNPLVYSSLVWKAPLKGPSGGYP